MTGRILESIYEPRFRDCSFGFRPERGCHDAIKDLNNHLFNNNVEVVLDIDLENFFGSIDHVLLDQFIREKVSDEKFVRYIKRTLKSGVLTGKGLQLSDEGVAQGSCCSPILAISTRTTS